MFFPEELDNKQFRLFVMRTWYLMNNHMALSPAEKELATLINEHPEIGIFIPGAQLEINRHYDEDEYNPFIYLSALWEIFKQLRDDRPEGIKEIVEKSFTAELSEPEKRSRLAQIYIDLYLMEKSGDEEFDEVTYLQALEQILNDPLYFENLDYIQWTKEEEPAKENEDIFYINNLFDHLFNALQHSFHKDASSKPININTKLQAALNKLPGDWVDAIAKFWKRPAVRLKRDRIKDLVHFLTSNAAPNAIKEVLDDNEQEILKTILDSDGYVRYGKISKKFGTEDEDDYWWTSNPPQSVIGRLRNKGLIFVGKAPIKSRNYKVIVIPQDLRSNIREALND